MSRSTEYSQGYRAATKDAVTFLHDEAKRMNDPHAVMVLNNAAFSLGVHFSRKAASIPGPPDGPGIPPKPVG